MAGHIDGSTREYGDGMMVSGEAGRVLAVRLLGALLPFRPLPGGIPLIAKVVRFG